MYYLLCLTTINNLDIADSGLIQGVWGSIRCQSRVDSG